MTAAVVVDRAPLRLRSFSTSNANNEPSPGADGSGRIKFGQSTKPPLLIGRRDVLNQASYLIPLLAAPPSDAEEVEVGVYLHLCLQTLTSCFLRRLLMTLQHFALVVLALVFAARSFLVFHVFRCSSVIDF